MSTHDQAIKKLSTEDYILIAKEHMLLEKFLDDLQEACACSRLSQPQGCEKCSSEQEASCQGRLPSFLIYAVDVASEHFDHEEKIMLARPHVTEEYEYFRKHRQAHEDILQQLNALVDECFALEDQGKTAEIYRQFHKRLCDIFDKHDRLFDDPFIESTQH